MVVCDGRANAWRRFTSRDDINNFHTTSRVIATMTDQLSRWMNSLLAAGPQSSCRGSCWEPAADVYQTDDGWLVKLDLAGVRPQDVAVHVDESGLVVSGCRRDQISERGASYYRMEISYSSFRRTIELPCNLGSAQIESQMRDGMLLIRIS
jgi:HSP20 family protein